MMLRHINPLAVLLKITRNQSADSAVSTGTITKDHVTQHYQATSHHHMTAVRAHTHTHTNTQTQQ